MVKKIAMAVIVVLAVASFASGAMTTKQDYQKLNGGHIKAMLAEQDGLWQLILIDCNADNTAYTYAQYSVAMPTADHEIVNWGGYHCQKQYGNGPFTCTDLHGASWITDTNYCTHF